MAPASAAATRPKGKAKESNPVKLDPCAPVRVGAGFEPVERPKCFIGLAADFAIANPQSGFECFGRRKAEI
jgi:hypothetical protein